ncbi:MAG: acyltransferase [Steroidobacteraceae bacterium]
MSIPSVKLPSETQTAGHLTYVDQLRGIAILMVIAVHAAQAVANLPDALIILLEYGQTGVQLFFVVSAFTLCRSHASRQSEENATLKFYLRRFFRIAPLYYLAIALYWTIGTVFDGFGRVPSPWAYSRGNTVANVLFAHGFIRSANNVVVPGGWSIGTEMAFYAVFPVLILICLQAYSHFRARATWMLAMAAFALSVAACIALAHSTVVFLVLNSFLYFNLLVQAPVFMLGVAAYFQYRESHMPIAAPACSVLAFLILTLLGIVLLQLRTSAATVMLPIASGASFVFLLDAFRTLQRNWRVLARIGQVSYSMYIFHFVFVWYGASLIWPPKSAVRFPSLVFAAIYVVGTILTFALAQVTEVLIERRGIAIGRWICACLTQR